MKRFLLLLLLSSFSLGAHTPSNKHLDAILHSLDPNSLTEHLTMYHLYPEKKVGKKALKRALSLLQVKDNAHSLNIPELDVQAIIDLAIKAPNSARKTLSKEQLQFIEQMASPLKNRTLKGHSVWSLDALERLDTEDVDLGRGLLLHTFDNKEDILNYEAHLDLMTLQILAKLPENASPQDKVRAINHFIFHEMQFRFPPHSLYAKAIDEYTLLPSVIDSRKGVCLGVSILYLCLAQRLDLSLDIITPPGHIYLSLPTENGEQNIETTARGIDIPSSTYLGINTCKLQKRTMKEVVGLAFINQASVAWQNKEYEGAKDLYEKALPYLPKDPLLHTLLGYNYLFLDHKKEGKSHLKTALTIPDLESVYPDTVARDYLKGRVDMKGIKCVFMPVDANRKSIEKKRDKLQKTLKRYPRFREGLLQLAVTHLQLGQSRKALPLLEKLFHIDPNNPVTAYYLSAVYLERLNYPKAWNYLRFAENILAQKNHTSPPLKELRKALKNLCPESACS